MVNNSGFGFANKRTLKEKWSHFDLNSWVTAGTKIWPAIPSNCRIFESKWFDIESQFDSIIVVADLQEVGARGADLQKLALGGCLRDPNFYQKK